ncbi:MAG: MMPL family transporter [Actinomycetota bacterium]|nr:MMPL family transporter [Actinomycetota bacterium]MDQ3717048.1 MMPL family transporter [Actinomycetota bacterium]
MTEMLHRLGGWCARHPVRTIGIWIGVVAAITILAGMAGGVLRDTMTVPGSSSERATERLTESFPQQAGAHAHVIASAPTGPIDSTALDQTAAEVADIPGVAEVRTRISDDGSSALVDARFDTDVADLDAQAVTQALTDAGQPFAEAGAEVAVGGQIPESIQGPNGVAEGIGVGVALIILLLAFGSALAAGLPLIVAGVGVGAGIGLITLLAAAVDVNTVSPTLGAMLGLGVGIDYALFIIARHRQGLAAGASRVEAAASATATAGHSVVVAGVSVLIGITGLVFSGIPSFASMGFAAGLVVLATMAVSITLLPALLGLAGVRVFGRRARRAHVLPMDSFHSPRAQRLASRVVGRPAVWLTVSVLALLVLAAPALGMRLGQSDAGSESADKPTRQAYDLVSASFGPGTNGPLLLIADRSAGEQVDRLAADVATVDGIAEVLPPVIAPDQSTALIQVIPTTGPSDAATGDLVRRLADQLPEGVDITGPTAAVLDMTTTLSAHLWWVILAVLAASFVLLLVVFRSIVLPLKAVVGNLLSVSASFGVLTFAFQTELGAQLLGLPGPIPIVAWAPVILFAILFGLSMDYEVFMLAAIREQREAGVIGRAGIVSGLSSTTRIITSAAAIMIAVAAGFALDPSVMVKIIGVGMATAILVDVTLVRMLLVPSAMALLGERNWYLPRWLDRILPGATLTSEGSLAEGFVGEHRHDVPETPRRKACLN